MSNQTNTSKKMLKTTLMILVCVLVVSAGIAGMTQMISSKQPAPKKPVRNTGITVETAPVEIKNTALSVTGYGQAEPVTISEISAQVSGRVTHVTSLKEGETVTKGSLLFLIDTADYKIAEEKAEIQVRLNESQVSQLKVSFQKDSDRLTLVKKNTALAQANFLRLKTLYETSRVGTLSSVESAEQSYNSLLDTEKNLIKAIELYPLQIAEAEAGLANAKADLSSARLDVDRCVVKAPFTGRIKSCSIETGVYVTIGTQALVLADDSLLEIKVPLSDKNAFESLNLDLINGEQESGNSTRPMTCTIESVTGNTSVIMTGSIHRMVNYDSDARTLTLAVRTGHNDTAKESSTVRLMDGMFCKVIFQGRSIQDTVTIPNGLLNLDNTIYIVRDQRLKTLPVVKIMETGDEICVTGNFELSDQIITSRLSSPVENQIVSTTKTDTPVHESSLALYQGDR